jgi:hypothetical protein
LWSVYTEELQRFTIQSYKVNSGRWIWDEVLTALNKKNYVLWNGAPCSLVVFYQCFTGTSSLKIVAFRSYVTSVLDYMTDIPEVSILQLKMKFFNYGMFYLKAAFQNH